MTEKAQAYFSRIQPGGQPPLAQTDPEFVDRFASFAFDEVVNMPLTEGMEPIDDRTRSLARVIGADKRCDGYLEGGGYLVSWCVGHLVELSAPERYDDRFAKWR